MIFDVSTIDTRILKVVVALWLNERLLSSKSSMKQFGCRRLLAAFRNYLVAWFARRRCRLLARTEGH